MYKFVTIAGSCGSPYNLAKAEQTAVSMAQQGFRLAHVFQSTTPGCFGTNNALVMVFTSQPVAIVAPQPHAPAQPQFNR